MQKRKTVWVVHWNEGENQFTRSFDKKKDAEAKLLDLDNNARKVMWYRQTISPLSLPE